MAGHRALPRDPTLDPQLAWKYPDEQRRSADDDEREIRTRWLDDDTLDGRVVTVWRKGRKP